MNDIRHISQEDLTLYAMQALAPEEVPPVEAHLVSCPSCREELSVLLGDIALLALSVDQHPAPQGSFERLRSRRQAEAGSLPTESASAVAAAAAPAVNNVAASNVVELPRRRRAWPVILPWAIAAMLAIGCIFLGVENRNLNDTVDDESALVSNLAAKASHAQEVLDVLNAPNAQRVTLTAAKTPPAPTAHAFYLQDRGALLFQASNLKPLPAGKTYELWVIPANGKAPLPAGTFRPDARGYASVVLPKLPPGVPAKMFGVTIENEGGAQSPTMPIVLAGE